MRKLYFKLRLGSVRSVNYLFSTSFIGSIFVALFGGGVAFRTALDKKCRELYNEITKINFRKRIKK